MTSAAGAPDTSGLTLESMDHRELDGGDNLLQSGFWGNFKAAAGWTPRGFRWEYRSPAASGSGGFHGRFLLLERRFPGNLRMAYVPYGPVLPEEIDADTAAASALLGSVAGALKKHLPKSCFVIRFDLAGGTRGRVGTPESSIRPDPLRRPLRPAPYRVQPPDTVILNLEAGEEELLAGMHKKTRYNIRLAEKKGVVIHRHTREDALKTLPLWYELYRETGRRDGISLHPESYYRRLFENTLPVESGNPSLEPGVRTDSPIPGLSLYTAEHEGDTLAGIIVSRIRRRSTYMYGASGAYKRKLMPNQLLQWTAIRDARNEGAEEYDFFGIPPADDPSHPMHGLWRFKTGFGGEILHYRGAWDYPLKPAVYFLYRWVEMFRGHLAARRKKQSL